MQNRPGSDLDGLARVWPHVSGLEASCAGIIGPGFWQDATSPLPVSHFQTRFRYSTDVPDNTVQNQPWSDLVLADCIRFWPNGSGPEASRCARILRPASGQCFPADPDRMRIGSGMFTGYNKANGTFFCFVLFYCSCLKLRPMDSDWTSESVTTRRKLKENTDGGPNWLCIWEPL